MATDGASTYAYDPSGGLVGVGSAAAGGGTTAGSGSLAFVDLHTDVVGRFAAAGTALAGSTAFDPLGNVLAATGQQGRLGYQSGWTDPSTGVVDMAARWYDPAVGQFQNRDTVTNDPVPNSAAANPFAYANDNPMTGTDPTGHGLFDFIGNAFNAVVQVVAPAVRYVAAQVNTYIVQPVVHAFRTVVHVVKDVYHAAVHVVRRVVHAAVRVVRTVYHAAVQAVKTAYHAVKTVARATVAVVARAATAVGQAYHAAAHAVAGAVRSAATSVGHAVGSAASAATTFVQNHASTILSIGAGVATFAACEAATVGVGSIGCAALAGAVGNAVAYGLDCHNSATGCSVGGAVQAVAVGGLAGAVGGALGELAGPLISRLVGPALDGVLPETAIPGLTNSGTRAATAGSADTVAASSGSRVAVSAARTSGGRSAGGSSVARACEANSFVAGTPVLMADRRSEPIDKVHTGDKVVATDPATGQTAARTVTGVIAHNGKHRMVDIGLGDGSQITATDHHPFWDATTATFVYAADLHIGDKVRGSDGAALAVTSARSYDADLTAYNLTVDDIHTYYAGTTPVLVHNSCTPAAEGASSTGRDALGRFTGAGGYGADAEAQGLSDYELATGQTAIRRR